jgi:hypothetical protein
MSNEIIFWRMEFANIFVLIFFIAVIVFYAILNIYPLCIHLYESIKALCTNFKFINLYYLPLEILVCLIPLMNLMIVDYVVLERLPNWIWLTMIYVIIGSAIGIVVCAI